MVSACEIHLSPFGGNAKGDKKRIKHTPTFDKYKYFRILKYL